ncbi:MAG: AbrB/MazE/SpoVT family DNA-binding domain-containing protein [Mesorhizobium sp.]|uniref:AbrB/MazE/SpoVT family DNA-binding domain-containing protein n=1 Tax=unclassified Mesorhizobium TaxID=325217 RepID=UPI00048A0748|nr:MULTISPECIES: AbrB/MazE/SpoVT family DNA-binding domain-containing protein [unclassified Mesorhizobium]RWO35386.1 MAG: AbrB/MazE/SpoVT family DNA-binding domain-containing protein [Mesorhizobium sp.]RWP12442.1 MAG: AbrB/MazE/SpoVT family DNA-binding domain-containing protein [Mesorhizobium sp.]RWP16521.1 MAG: AbrB/MazE/SpoVT family DNA-binding domain-containing protein [Mesorhizobium sp.]RWP61368.1 MAG: AbrB/MazE/SpoVT family DNA-binding domain-containing protein [Mesorhizobium sp.]RWQ27251
MPQRRHSKTPPKEAKLFRNNRSQAVRIPVEFELPGEKVLISREGDRLVIEPVRKPGLSALLAQWAQEPPLGPEGDFPETDDMPVKSEELF